MEKLEDKFFDLLRKLGIQVECGKKFDWLTNKVEHSELELWRIFMDLGGDGKGMRSKGLVKLPTDGFLPRYKRIIEFDELQHFTEYRLKTLDNYPKHIRLGFDKNAYQKWCKQHATEAINKGPYGYRSPKPDFPFEEGRAAQRALFDACRDLLSSKNNLNPTIRISQFQLPSLLGVEDKEKAAEELQTALEAHL